MSSYIYLILLVLIIIICTISKRGVMREGLNDPCSGYSHGCYQFQAAGNLVPARTDTAPPGGWTEESCMNTRLLASGKWCGAAPPPPPLLIPFV